jgi:hypothetical protein
MTLVIGIRPIMSKPTPFAHTSLQSSNYTVTLATTFLKKILKLSLFCSTILSRPQTVVFRWNSLPVNELLNFFFLNNKSFLFRKSPGFNLVTAEVARQLTKKALIHLTHILNSILLSWNGYILLQAFRLSPRKSSESVYPFTQLNKYSWKPTEKVKAALVSRLISVKNQLKINK